ncbi:unnamed protein product [Zymoseptoria tritici ST99CH_3D7]|uniref:Gylcosyl hydrolase 115 C-terminal domain-containing protein n=1 Tax=Zymoseptoria tritici (strain ST99CH_3D7) TaxID=1276538 RepID=A0A1X7RC99_ZYMT9|nr:unnamed protein product [Zymoseptoria tritici ST99CH_3D7]
MSFLRAIAFLASGALAIGQRSTVNFDGSGILLASNTSFVNIYADPNDWPAVLRVCDDLAMDFGRITGTNGSVIHNGNGTGASLNASMIFNVTGRPSFGVISSGSASGGVIIAGTLGRSSVIDRLVAEGKLDVTGIEGSWEAYVSAIVHDPLLGVEEAMVIAGSDRRGSVFGLYSVSEQIGVSPWYYWADSPPQKHSSVYADNTTVIQASPSVKYRGFFINDEAPALTGWIDAKFPPSPWGPGFGAEFYASVFELLLRLRANYLWPASWNSMMNIDDPRTQALADEYGIVMGSSHTEPMMRATKEWSVFGDGPWDWTANNKSIYPFFVEGAERAKPYEGVLTMGMRGSGDTALAPGIQTELLEDVVATQTEILTALWGNDSVQNTDVVPQMWCLYKEVQGYYEAGMSVPEYMTLLWTDDNWGNIRRLPLKNETSRSGNAGVYYHFDYVGDPRNYKWINTIPLQKTWQQMNLAYERDARRIWVVNVGDIKPLELPISHFMDLAYDIKLWNERSVPSYLEMWAAREFGLEVAHNTAVLLNNYSIAAGRRKFELVDPATFSLINYDEADKNLDEWKAMQTTAQSIMDSLPAETQPAFFEMVYHPVTAGYVYYDIMISSARNNLYARQGRNSANSIAEHTHSQFKKDRELTEQYNGLLDGKWDHMMDQTHIGYEYWQQPMRQRLPGLRYNMPGESSLAGGMGVSVEGNNATVPGDDAFHQLSSQSLTMATFNPYGATSQWIEIYSMGADAFDFNISANGSFVQFSETTGHITPDGASDKRIYASFDWNSCPEGSGIVLVNISSIIANTSQYREETQYGTQYGMPQIMLPYENIKVPNNFTNGFVESDGHISIELEHYSAVTSESSEVQYKVIPGLSRTLSGVSLFPVTADSQSAPDSPGLEYKLYTFTDLSGGIEATPDLITGAGTGMSSPADLVNITIVTTPSLNTIPERPLKYAIQFDEEDIKTVQYVVDQPKGANPVGWLAAVANNAWMTTSNFTYSGHGEHTLRIWALEPNVVLNTAWIDLGGLRPSYLGPPESTRIM